MDSSWKANLVRTGSYGGNLSLVVVEGYGGLVDARPGRFFVG